MWPAGRAISWNPSPSSTRTNWLRHLHCSSTWVVKQYREYIISQPLLSQQTWFVIKGCKEEQVRQCLGFCTADFWSWLVYESAVQKPKHCLTCSFLHRLLKRYSVYRVDMAPEMQKQAKRAALASAGNCSVSSVTSIPSTLYNTIRCISLIYRFAHVVAEHC